VDRAEPAVEWAIRLCGWSAILFVFAILFFVSARRRHALRRTGSGRVLIQSQLAPSSEVRPQYGILALLVGTLSVTGLAMPWRCRWASDRRLHLRVLHGQDQRNAQVLVELLAAIPSVVWGFVSYMVLAPIILDWTGAPVGVNLLNGGVILALMSVPIIVSVGEDALKAVPDAYREAALSLGASRWELVRACCFRPPRMASWRPCCLASAARSARPWPC